MKTELFLAWSVIWLFITLIIFPTVLPNEHKGYWHAVAIGLLMQGCCVVVVGIGVILNWALDVITNSL